MPTQNITVDAVTQYESGFDVNPSACLSNASDGNLATTFSNNVANQTLTFDMENIADYAVLANAAAITGIKVSVTFASGGKGAGSLTVKLTNGAEEPEDLQSDNFSESSTSQANSVGTEYDASSNTDAELNAMQIVLIGTNSAVNVVSHVGAVISYTAAAVAGAGEVTMSLGALKMSTGEITI